MATRRPYSRAPGHNLIKRVRHAVHHFDRHGQPCEPRSAAAVVRISYDAMGNEIDRHIAGCRVLSTEAYEALK